MYDVVIVGGGPAGALIFWSFVWGVWGTLLAVLVSVNACYDRIEDLKPIRELLGE